MKRERERMTKTKTKTKSGEEMVPVSGIQTKTKAKASGSGMSNKKKKNVEVDFDLDEFERQLMARTMETLAKKEEDEPKPKPKPKKRTKKRSKPRSAIDPGNLRKTRLQTEKEKDAKVKVSFPGGYNKDPRHNDAQEMRQFLLTEPDDVDSSGSESEPDDPFDPTSPSYNLLKQGVGPHIKVEDLVKLAIYTGSRRAKDPLKGHESLLKTMEKDGACNRAKKDLSLSKKALAFFNRQHNSDYELVETLGSFIGEYDGKWLYHCNFKAQKCPQLKDSRPLPKLFFGELFSWRDNRGEEVYDVQSCYVLDFCPTVRGCEICPKPILHPKDKFVRSDKDSWPF